MSDETTDLPKEIKFFVKQNSKEHQKIIENQKNQGNRLRRLELFKAAVKGGLAVLGCIIGGGVATYILKCISDLIPS